MLFLRASRMIPGHEMFESFSLGLAGKGGGVSWAIQGCSHTSFSNLITLEDFWFFFLVSYEMWFLGSGKGEGGLLLAAVLFFGFEVYLD